MSRAATLVVACLVAAALSTSAEGQVRRSGLEVTAVRFWSLSDATRVAIETSGEFRFHFDRLHNPERIFFDLVGTRPNLGGRRISATNVEDKILKRIRVAETQPGVTRVVLDLQSEVQFSASQLGNPDRLMIELSLAPKPTTEIAESVPDRPVLPEPELKLPPAPLRAPPVLASTPLPARPAKRTSDGDRSLIRALGLKLSRVVIDAGHGGLDQGTVGPHGLTEKALVLDVAKRLGKLIEQRMGSEVVYTRTDDTFVPLEARTELANRTKADLFLSLHANSSAAPKAGGVETYYLNFTTAPDALDLAARENASSQKTIYELHDLIQTITLHDKAEESREFAGDVQTALQSFSLRYNPSARNRGVKKAPFVVLIGATMPSVLAEIGFLSNPREEALLNHPEHRQKLAEALYRGVWQYARSLSHFQVAQVKP